MLDWLKTILGDAYTEDIDKKIAIEIGRNFVARADFNATKNELKTAKDTIVERDGQLETLKNSAGDVAALRTQITTLQEDNMEAAERHRAEIKRLKIDAAARVALAQAKAKDIKAAKELLNLEGAELTEDENVKGLDEQIKKLIESPESNSMFDVKQSIKGFNPSEKGDLREDSKALSDMTYDELCTYLAENPGAQLK